MDLRTLFRKLAGLGDPGGAVVTVTLDVSQSGILPPATRVFLKDRVLTDLASERWPARTREVLRSISERLQKFVHDGLRPEANGLFLVASPGVWQPVELMVPLENFIHVGRTPHLAPLLEAGERWPRVYVFRCSEREGLIQEFQVGVWSDVERVRCAGLDVVEQDTERLQTGRAITTAAGRRRVGSGIGGGKRDRFEHTVEVAATGMIAAAAGRVGALHAKFPARLVLMFGGREHFFTFRDYLPEVLQDQARYSGPIPRRDEERLRQEARQEVERFTKERVEGQTLEFLERRSQGRQIALGPGEVLAHVETGRLARVFLDAGDPVAGVKCPGCGRRYPGVKPRCPLCKGYPVPVSLTQEIVAHAMTHPPLPVTFVRRPAGWLRDLGGMAALLSAKGIRRRTVST